MNTYKWVLILLCLCGWYFLLKNQRVSDLELLFKYKYSGNPQSEVNTVPIITDIDGDGKTDIIMAPFATKKLSIYNFEKGELKLKRETTLPGKYFPVYITSGYDRKYNDNDRRQQIIIVIMRDFEIICYNSDLTIRWKQNYYKEKAKAFIQEISAIVVPYDIQTKYSGAVIAAFRTTNDQISAGKRLDKEFEEEYRVVLDQTYTEQKEDLINDNYDIDDDHLNEHMSYYAFSVKDGQVIWQHEMDEKDQFLELVQNEDDTEKYRKIRIYGSILEDFGEVQWHEFHDAVFQNLPHTWNSYYDTSIVPSHFSRDMKSNPEKRINPNIRKLLQSYNSFDLILNPNVLVIHQKNGIEVVHLYTGKPLLHVNMISTQNPASSSFADINGDDSLDEIYTHSNVHTLQFNKVNDDILCYVQGMTLSNFQFLFAENVCTKAYRFDILRRQEEDREIMILPPLLVPNGLTAHDGRPQYDVVVLNNFGLMTGVSGNGKIKWQADVQSYWDINEKDANTFKPSLTTFHTTHGKTNMTFIVSQGSKYVNVVDLNGNILAKKEFDHICKPIMPPLFGDVNNDKRNDIIIVTDDHIMAYKFEFIPSVEFLPICIAVLIILISYNIYLVAVSYYKKLE